MDVCLVSPPTAAEFSPLEVSSEAAQRTVSQPQLGILSLAAVLAALGNAPSIVDLNAAYIAYVRSSGSSDREGFATLAAELLAAQNAGVYGFGTICSSYPLIIRIAAVLKSLLPESTVLLGGPQASVVDHPTLAAFPFVDYILRGEAEHSLPLWLEEHYIGERMDRVPGLTYRRDGVPTRNPNAPPIKDLDDLPSPAYHLTGQLRGADIAALEMGRGCPFSCTFCSTNDFFRRNFRLRSPERILRDMRAINSEYGIRDFELVHDMFTVDRKRVVTFCDAMIASGEGFTWSCSARTDCIDEPLLELMARAGCNGIFYGIEAGSVRMQKLIDKGLDPKVADDIIDATERHGIRSTVSLITGFPEETWDDLRDSVRIFMHSARLAKSSPQLNLLAPLAETPIHAQFKDSLILEELCSDVSQQGVNLDAKDFELIRNHPEIFPNFYLVPTKYLDHSCLLELREFSLNVDGRLQWLLSAVDQVCDDFLDHFALWREHCMRLHPGLGGFPLREYYRGKAFRFEYFNFLRSIPTGQHPLVKAFIECEEAISQTKPLAAEVVLVGRALPPSESPVPRDVPIRKNRVRVISLPWDIQRLINALKARSDPEWIAGPHYYVTKEISSETDQLVRISDWVAILLEGSDGSRNVGGLMEYLSRNISGVESDIAPYVWPKLLDGVREMGLLDIYRSEAADAAIQLGAQNVRSYSEINDIASVQNQRSSQLQ